MNKISVALLLSAFVVSSACTNNKTGQEVPTQKDVSAEKLYTTTANHGNAPVYEKPERVVSDLGINLNGPVSITDTINMTLKNHHGLKVIRANLDAAKYQVERAKAGWGPRLDLQGNYGYDRQHPDDEDINEGLFPGGGISLTLTQPLWDGFATTSNVRSGQATVDALKATVFDNATTFTLDAIIAHIDVIRQREIVSLSKENVSAHERILGQQRERVALGAAPSSDVTQTQGRLLNAKATLSQNIEALEAAEAQYMRLTGVFPPQILETVELPGKLYPDANEAFEYARTVNPKISSYLYDVDAAKYNKDLAKAGYHPQINLETGVSYSDRDTTGLNEGEYEKSFDVRVRMDWNLFHSFADKNAVRSANSSLVESRQVVLNFLDELKAELDNTYSQYYSAIDQQKYYQQAKVYNRETKVAYVEQFALGTRSLSDILDIESEYFTSSIEELTSKGNITVGAYRIIALIGTLVPALDIDEELYNTLNISDFENQSLDL